MSDESRKSGVGPVQPPGAPDCSWVTIRSAPGARSAAGQPVYVQVSMWRVTPPTWTVLPELLTIRMAPPSYTQAETGAHPSNVVWGDPAHGVGKLAGSARRLAAEANQQPM